MNILFLNAYFNPEIIAFTHLENDLLKELTNRGHKVYILCPFPTRGLSKDAAQKYKKIRKESLYNDAVQVNRFWAPQEGKNPFTRFLRYVWCNIREYQIGRKYKEIDKVFAVSTPPTQGLTAGLVASKLGCPFIYSVQDIFPDSMVTAGLTQENSLIWKLGRKVENKTYSLADKIVVISEAMEKNLVQKQVPLYKICNISNWIDTENISPIQRSDNKLIEELQIDSNKFLVVYAGNLGESQGTGIILDAAKMLEKNSKILFVIFGSGSGYTSFAKESKILKNVIVAPLLPSERISEVYSLGDVALITCKKGAGISGMPSKTWSIMACNTPIIASFDKESELAEIIETIKCGICVEPENHEKLVQAIVDFCKHPLNTYNSRKYVEETKSKKQGTEKYINLIEETIRS